MNKIEKEAISKAYDWITRVVQKQERFLNDDDLYSSYRVMGFKPMLNLETFKKLTLSMKEAVTL